MANGSAGDAGALTGDVAPGDGAALARVVHTPEIVGPAVGLADRLQLVALGSLVLDPANARKHGKRNLQEIARSLRRFGQQKPIVVERDGALVRAGNGTVLAARSLGWSHLWVLWTDLAGTLAVEYGIADNRTAELAEWNDEVLAQLLAAIPSAEEVGFTAAEVKQLTDAAAAESDASLLARLNVTISEPKTVTVTGDVWDLGSHRLVVADVVSDVAVWLPYLEATMLFCPYPGPFVPLTLKAEAGRCLMVQPDAFIAGHVLDRWEEVHGPARKVVAGGEGAA